MIAREFHQMPQNNLNPSELEQKVIAIASIKKVLESNETVKPKGVSRLVLGFLIQLLRKKLKNKDRTRKTEALGFVLGLLQEVVDNAYEEIE